LEITSKKSPTMKTLLAIWLLAAAPYTWALDGAETPAPVGPVYQAQVLDGAGNGKGLPPGHPSISPAVSTEVMKVPKAVGANAQTVEAVNARRAELKDQVVLVRGKVVKYAPGIMGKNWIHLRDGTGSVADNTNDIVVTTISETKIGAVVTARGTVRTDKDFGSGYSYKVLIEEATLQP
jgi:hypothetical protein